MRLWRPIELEFARLTAMNEAVETHWRLYFLALIENRGDGHAHFGQGSLARALRIDPRDVPKAITAAAKRGLVRSGSTSRCIWLPSGHLHRASGTEPGEHYPCKHHKPRRRRVVAAANLRTVDPKMTPELRTVDPTSVSELRTVDPKFPDVSAGQDVSPSSSSTGPTDELSPAVSDPTPRVPHLHVVAS